LRDIFSNKDGYARAAVQSGKDAQLGAWKIRPQLLRFDISLRIITHMKLFVSQVDSALYIGCVASEALINTVSNACSPCS
jgi:hypothetical protein